MNISIVETKRVKGLKIGQRIDFLCKLLIGQMKYPIEWKAFIENFDVPLRSGNIDVELENIVDGILGYAISMLTHNENFDMFLGDALRDLNIYIKHSDKRPRLVRYKSYLN
jgi:hypothetical protein